MTFEEFEHMILQRTKKQTRDFMESLHKINLECDVDIEYIDIDAMNRIARERIIETDSNNITKLCQVEILEEVDL